MKIDKTPSNLGRLQLLGQRDGQQALWALDSRAQRVPAGDGNYDGTTPGVFSLRTLYVRGDSRKMEIPNPGNPTGPKVFIDYVEPMLIDYLASADNGDKGEIFNLDVFGAKAPVALLTSARVLASPVWERPGLDSISPKLEVPAFLMEEGSLQLASAIAMKPVLAALDTAQTVELRPDGLVYTANIPPPDLSQPIATRVLLSRCNGVASVSLLPQQSPEADVRWRQVWLALDTIAGALRAQAHWLRLGFAVDASLPQLRWVVTRKDNLLSVDWADVQLQQDITQVTLADQPVESQSFGPEQLLRLSPPVRLTRNDQFLEIESLDPLKGIVDSHYSWKDGTEKIRFDEMALVHDPARIREQLREVYRQQPAEPGVPVTGFLQLANGWLELPFEGVPGPKDPAGIVLPDVVGPSDEKTCQGSLILGNRRHEYGVAGQAPDAAPWSIQLDEPASYWLKIRIRVGTGGAVDALVSAKIEMASSALQAQGMAWLASTCPDANDALPRASDDPGAYFDLFLQRCTGKPEAAPFALQGLEIRAPQRQEAAGPVPPRVSAGATLAIRTEGIAPGTKELRAWLRHPTLPSVQVMGVTRSDTASTVPHASRALVPFAGKPQRLMLADTVTMFPRMDGATEARFEALKQPGSTASAVSLVALSLPGMELLPARPSDYQVCGAYTLPVFDEPHARAVVPPPDDEEPPPPPVITALDPAGLQEVMAQANALRARARTQDSSMFPAGGLGVEIDVTPDTLLPPWSWSAKVNVSSSIVEGIAGLTLGSAVFSQTSPAWTRTLSGDSLLSGPAETSLEAAGGVVVLKEGENLVGWSVHETADGDLVRDSRGVAWKAGLADLGATVAWEIQVRVAGNEAPETYHLLSTRDGLLVKGIAGGRWLLAFTDVPMKGRRSDLQQASGRKSAALNGWTWTLCDAPSQGQDADAAARAIKPLQLGPCLRFAPAALKVVQLADDMTIASVSIEGAVVLGDNRAVAQDTLRRAVITMTPDASGALAITGIQSARQDGRLDWDLDVAEGEGLLWSGSAQLSGRLALDEDDDHRGLWLREPQAMVSFAQHVFSGSLTLPLKLDVAAEAACTMQGTLVALEVGVEALTVDLRNARLSSMRIKGVLRNGVEFSITQSRGNVATAGMTWFGNEIQWTAHVDASRRACVLTSPKSAGTLSVFPGLADAQAHDGVACMSLVPQGRGLKIASLFMELSLMHRGELSITHLMHSVPNSQQDTLRFDGTWTHDSLIAWPDLAQWTLPTSANSAMVDFATAENQHVRHQVVFDLSNHVLEGVHFEPAAGKGIALKLAGKRPAFWLSEATHRLTWPGASPQVRVMRALHVLQLWSAESLGGELERAGKSYTFAPGFRGSPLPTTDFPRQGLRRSKEAWMGLFDSSMPGEIKKLKGAWVLLGGMTVMCRKPLTSAQQVLLHLPFAAVLGPTAMSDSLRKLLAAPAGTANSRLKMSRHDLMDDALRTEAPDAIPIGQLLRTAPVREIPFARDLSPSSLLSGAALAANWFGGRQPNLPGWQVEQFQRPGPSSERAPLPHPYARASAMLAVLRDQTGTGDQDVLSILVRHGPGTAPQEIERVTVRLQSRVASPSAMAAGAGGDLVVGGAGGVVVLPIGRADAAHEDPKHLLALAIGCMADPAFIVRRKAQDDDVYERCELPFRPLDPLEFAVRSLRPSAEHITDGHLTWPESFAGGLLGKADLAITVRPRAPRHMAVPLAMAAVAGRLQTARPMGMPFGLDGKGSGPVTHTVWLEEYDGVAFERTLAAQDDAAPWMQEAAVPSRPLVPSTRELARAMVQLDPSLANSLPDSQPRKFQTYLPAVADTHDFSSRAGAFVNMGVRGLAARNAARTESVPADGGPAVTRSFRRPRPMPLPANGADPRGWRRTVGWWGDKEKSCLSLRGPWDCLAGAAGQADLPEWSIYLGRALPYRLATQGRGLAPVWRGSVVVTCMVLEGDVPAANPAGRVLALLAAANGKSLRAGLRARDRWIGFSTVALAGTKDHPSEVQLVFSPPQGADFLNMGDCVFECGFRATRTIPDAAAEPLKLLPLERSGLDPADFRAMALTVRAPLQGRFPMPITRRTVFFSDPAFDMRLSRVEPRSVNQPFDNDEPDKVFNAWIDRQSVTPQETAVLRVAHNLGKQEADSRKFWLAASFIREGGRSQPLKFHLAAGGPALDAVVLQPGEYYALPISMLRVEQDHLRPGDTLVLEVQAGDPAKPSRARLLVPVKSRSVLPPPQAMYSLLAVDAQAGTSWCSLHSGLPVPEAMTTDVIATADRPAAAPAIIRRGVFKWVAIDPVNEYEFGYSLLKLDRNTESSHIPDKLEEERI